MRKLIVYNIFAFIFCISALSAQTNQMLRDQVYAAEKDKDWYAATQYYQRLYFRDSSDVKIQYRYANASRLVFDVDLALHLYFKVASVDNGKKYPLTFFYIGQLLKNKEQYKTAQQWFNKFYKLKVSEKKGRRENIPYYKKRAKLEIEACDFAQIQLNHPVMDLPERLDAVVNTKASEYAAFEKDSSLYFSTIRMPERRATKNSDDEFEGSARVDYYSKIYKSDIRLQKYKKIKALDTTFNSKVFHSANACFSADGKTMIISRCAPINASENSCELFQTTMMKKRWMTPLRMDEPINKDSTSTTQPNFGEIEGKTVLFFASNRPGGEGGLDIWYSFRDEKGIYADPINAGKLVNSPEDEVSPWFEKKDSTLYFSSPYHIGFGGFDVFKSKYKDGKFGEPKNAGYPINSAHNDLYYSANDAGTRIYLSSNRKGSFFENKVNCCSDIYNFKIDTAVFRPPVIDTVVVVKEQLKLLVPLTLYFHNDEPEPRTTLTVTSKNYESIYNDYKILTPKYLLEYSNGLKGDEKVLATNLIENFFSDSVDTGLENLKKFSEMLVKVLENGETVKITMKGYCSPLASTNYNVNLAKRRISSLRNFFLEYQQGVFVKYIDNQASNQGKLIFEDVEVGELPVSRASDDYKDKRNSVYSPFAASERKIQILAISYGN